MKHFAFDDHWDGIKAQLKERFAHLTEDDLNYAAGKGEQLFARLRERLGLSVQELNTLLNELKAHAAKGSAQVKTKADEIADEVRAKVAAAFDDVRAKGAAAADEVRAQAGAAYDEARARARSLRGEGEEYVRQNPREVLVAALCAGFVAGLLIRH